MENICAGPANAGPGCGWTACWGKWASGPTARPVAESLRDEWRRAARWKRLPNTVAFGAAGVMGRMRFGGSHCCGPAGRWGRAITGRSAKRGGQSDAAFGRGIERGGLEGIRFGQTAQRRSGQDRASAAVAAGDHAAAPMDLLAAGDGFLEIHQSEAL